MKTKNYFIAILAISAATFFLVTIMIVIPLNQ